MLISRVDHKSANAGRPATPAKFSGLLHLGEFSETVPPPLMTMKQNPEVKKVLLATGDLILKPHHHQEPNAPTAWRYYEILTQIRGELQKQK